MKLDRQKEQREKALKALEKARKSPRKERIIPMGMTGEQLRKLQEAENKKKHPNFNKEILRAKNASSKKTKKK